MPKVEIYSKFTCPFCYRAKALLQSKGVDFEEYEVTMDNDLRAQMIERSNGGSTVPQIFIDGQHVGGSDDLAALDREGRLDTMLGV